MQPYVETQRVNRQLSHAHIFQVVLLLLDHFCFPSYRQHWQH